jgi:hypothetical protein
MLRRLALRLYQVGAHVPHGSAYQGATVKNWPRQSLPSNFSFLPEQRWKLQGVPRDSGVVPRDFVLKTLYMEQPCEVESLWALCAQDPSCVLDSKRHLREVLRQCREEGFVAFEKVAGTDSWQCLLTRERYEEVRAMVAALPESGATPMSAGMRGEAAEQTAASAEGFRSMTEDDKRKYLDDLRRRVAETTESVSQYQRMEADYLPFTDLNGKVKFMWWYEVREAPLPEGATPTLEGTVEQS